jgi:hypothetical protein
MIVSERRGEGGDRKTKILIKSMKNGRSKCHLFKCIHLYVYIYTCILVDFTLLCIIIIISERRGGGGGRDR